MFLSGVCKSCIAANTCKSLSASPAFTLRSSKPVAQRTLLRSYAKKLTAQEKERMAEIDEIFEKSEFLSRKVNRPDGWDEFGGDAKKFQELNEEELDMLPVHLSTSKEMESAPEILKKLFSLRYSSRKEHLKFRLEETVRKYQYHYDDWESTEAKIAALTVKVRNLKRHITESRRDGHARLLLNNIYQHRNMLIQRLRDWNADQHSRMSAELGLVPVVLDEPGTWKKRNKYLRKFAIERYWQLKNEKLDALKVELERQKVEFVEHKREALERIEREEHELGITNEDIENVLNPTELVPGVDGMRRPPLKVRAP